MGAADFMTRASGATAKEAFQNATAEARHEYGHRAYTGSIAEKTGFQMLTVPDGKTLEQFAEEIVCDDEHWASDKRGPAACFALGDTEFLFVGVASC
jgi:hypothetical protein